AGGEQHAFYRVVVLLRFLLRQVSFEVLLAVGEDEVQIIAGQQGFEPMVRIAPIDDEVAWDVRFPYRLHVLPHGDYLEHMLASFPAGSGPRDHQVLATAGPGKELPRIRLPFDAFLETGHP